MVAKVVKRDFLCIECNFFNLDPLILKSLNACPLQPLFLIIPRLTWQYETKWINSESIIDFHTQRIDLLQKMQISEQENLFFAFFAKNTRISKN